MKILTGALAVAVLALPAMAQKDAKSRLQAATEDLREMMNASDKGIPQDLIAKASCIVVVPNLKSGGFIVGGQYGKGFFTCRKPSGVGWSAPGSVKLSGGKFGLLIGGKETDVIMLVMNQSGMEHLLSNKFQIGGEAAAAAGPVGRDSSAMTDAALHAEILTYSRSRGLFGGLDIGGSAVTEDDDSNRELYGSKISNKEILNGNPKIPAEAQPFIHELDRISSRK
ncbi:MAG: lipid-binding SYLF domain-containing protein [Acidobacteriaceae bacterium]|nr:lipid-binding SYLF domain-containing protein [Acidobacteriaceae bacterium]